MYNSNLDKTTKAELKTNKDKIVNFKRLIQVIFVKKVILKHSVNL